MVLFLMFIVLSYILGSIPFGVIVGKKFKQLDIREHGSKNTGATNAIRVLGKKLGFFVLFLDIAKGFLPVFLASNAGITGIHLLIIGIISILGHTFSPFINFKGGKGVATSLGVFLFFVPEVILLSVLIFIAIVYFTRYISLASITVAALFPCMVILLRGKERADVVVVGIVIAFYIIYKHKSNIKRLIQGNENKFSLK